MLRRLSNKISSFFINKSIIQQEERETYNFCFEILLSTIVNTVIIIALAIAFKIYVEALLFTVTFMMFRGVCGGAHAKTHIGCLLGLLGVFSLFIVGLKFLPQSVAFWLTIALGVIAAVLILLLCPIDNINKPLSDVEKKKCKIKSRIYLLVFMIPIVLFAVFDLWKFAFSITYPIFFVALSLIVGRIINLRNKQREIIVKDVVDNKNLPKST